MQQGHELLNFAPGAPTQRLRPGGQATRGGINQILGPVSQGTLDPVSEQGTLDPRTRANTS